jgi:8-oxo-dGTP diphosphatase
VSGPAVPMTGQGSSVASHPYKIAVLCYLYDDQGRVLLLHRRKPPNVDMYSPIGGKLEIAIGEGPHECALREIREEADLALRDDEIRLTGIISERAYQDETHWLIFLFEVTRPVRPDEVPWTDFDEGRLEWVHPDDVPKLPIPDTDRLVMWPSVQAHRGGFFMAHIDCSVSPFTWQMVESSGRTAAAS